MFYSTNAKRPGTSVHKRGNLSCQNTLTEGIFLFRIKTVRTRVMIGYVITGSWKASPHGLERVNGKEAEERGKDRLDTSMTHARKIERIDYSISVWHI